MNEKRSLSEDEWKWRRASFRRMITEFGRTTDNPDSRLVLPIPGYFPPQALIRQNPKHFDVPSILSATFAHELSHYLISAAKTAQPGDWNIYTN